MATAQSYADPDLLGPVARASRSARRGASSQAGRRLPPSEFTEPVNSQ